MTDIPLPGAGDTDWMDWATEQEDLTDQVRANGTPVEALTAGLKAQVITQAAYDALGTKGANTLYFISG